MHISLSVSPDADDLFMVRGLLEGRIDTGRYRFEIGSSPTDALNRLASSADAPEVLAISIGHYPQIADRYQLLPHGGSMGEGYGPVVVSTTPGTLDDLHGRKLAIPGHTTTAWMVLRLLLGAGRVPDAVEIPIAPHERVFEALETGEVDFALLIHEGRLTYGTRGLQKVIDIGEAWAQTSQGLPLPLGANVIRRDLGPDTIRELSELMRQSIRFALEDREASIDWLLAKGGALSTRDQVSRYLSMYANERTLDYGEDGRKAIELLFRRAVDAGFLSAMPPVDFAP